MATIRKRGNGYQIRVSVGYDSNGKQIIKTKSWTPSKGMTAKQIEKELNKQAVTFEQQVETGQFLDGSVTLSNFIDKWLKEYASKQLREKTLTGYKDMLPVIIQALGHIRLAKLKPHHLQEFYNNLSENGVRRDTKYCAIDNFKKIMQDNGFTQQTLAKEADVSLQCVRSCCDGRNVSQSTAKKIADKIPVKDLFVPVKAEAKLADSTISKYHHILSSILTTAVQWQVIPSNPCERVKPPRVKYKEAKVLDDEQVQQLIKCLENEPLKYKTAIMLILYTGMRRGELCGLNWEDIDIDRGVIHITKSLLYTQNKGVYEDTTKTEQSQRVVNIPVEMITLLREYRLEQNQLKLSLGDQWQDSGKVIVAEYGGALSPDTLSSWYKKFIKRHNLPDSHIHTLRHVSATLLIAGGVDVATVSKRLGHANKTTTLNIYTHAIKSADAVAAEKLQNMLSPKKNFSIK